MNQNSSSPIYDWAGYGGNAAELYEKYMVPVLFGPYAEDLLKLTRPEQGERILDVACGTGIVTRLVASVVGNSGKIVGLDLNPAMLAVAGELPCPQGHNIKWLQCDAKSIPLPDTEFDRVYCQQGLTFFSHRSAALSEMRRVLALGGKLALSVWTSIEHSDGFYALSQALGKCISKEAEQMAMNPFSLGCANELTELIELAGFMDIHLHKVKKSLHFPAPDIFVERYLASTPIARAVSNASEVDRKNLISEVCNALTHRVNQHGLTFSIEAHVVEAHI